MESICTTKFTVVVPPIILIHGLGLDHSMWDPQIPEFSRSYQVIVYDLRGHGRSGSLDHPYSIDLLADDRISFSIFWSWSRP